MTVCNMSIEAGARAGHDRARRHDLRVPRGPPVRAAGRRLGARARRLARAARPTTGATFDTRASTSTPPALAPQVTWGTNPGMVVPVDGACPIRRDYDDPDEREAGRARARLHGPAAGHARSRTSPSTASSSARAPTRASRTCAPRPRSLDGQHVHRRRARAGGPRLGAGEARRPRTKGSTRSSRAAGFEWRERGLLDVPRDEPGHPAARRALRLDVEPQLRGPAGPGRANASGQPGDGRRGRGRRPLRRHPSSRAATRREAVPQRRPRARAARPRRRRHRPDHPEAIPEAHRAHGLRRVPLLRLDREASPDFVLQPAGVRRARASCSPGRNFGCGSSREHARVGARRITGFARVIAPSLRRHLPDQRAEDRALPVVLPEKEVER